MQLPVSARLVSHLNALINNQVSLEVAAAAITAADVAHHVVDPELVLGLDPFSASDLETALAALLTTERSDWYLALPVPGSLASLRGPRGFNEAALEAGEAVIASQAELGLVPHAVGRAVQWRVFRANRPFAPLSPYEAELALSEAVLSAAKALAALELSAGSRPRLEIDSALAPGYSPRQRATADRAARLLVACDAALADHGGALSSFDSEARLREIRKVRGAASQALCSACTWIGAS